MAERCSNCCALQWWSSPTYSSPPCRPPIHSDTSPYEGGHSMQPCAVVCRIHHPSSPGPLEFSPPRSSQSQNLHQCILSRSSCCVLEIEVCHRDLWVLQLKFPVHRFPCQREPSEGTVMTRTHQRADSRGVHINAS